MDFTLLILALATAIVVKWAYKKVAGPTAEADVPEVQDAPKQEISEVDASVFLTSAAKMAGDFVDSHKQEVGTWIDDHEHNAIFSAINRRRHPGPVYDDGSVVAVPVPPVI